MWRLAIVLGVLAAPWFAAAEEHVVRDFEKRVLTDKFYSEGAHAGDFNADGKLDVVAGPFLYLGPDFKQKATYYDPKPYDKHGYSENFFAWAHDFNADGYDDVLVVGFPGKEAILHLNPKDLSKPWPKHAVVEIVDNESPWFADVTGDGKPELVCSMKGQYCHAGPDPSDPTKPWKVNFISDRGDYQRFTHGLGIGDVNGDGRPDLLAKDGWWEQPAEDKGQLWKKHPFDFSSAGGAQMFAYDFDGDGDNDVLTSLMAHAYGLVWYENTTKDGAITFVPHVIMGEKVEQNPYGVVFSQLHAVELVDMDGDGLKDILTGKRHWAHGPKGDPDSQGPAVLYWFKTVRGPKGVEFIPYRIDDSSGVGTQVLAKDVDGDGRPDVVVGNKMGAFLFLQRPRKVSKEEWEKAQPKRIGPPTAKASADRPAANADRRDRSEGIVPVGDDGRPLNLGFETGTLDDWLAKGDAFAGQPIKGDAVHARRSDMHSRHAGNYWVGSFERGGDEPTGTLVSRPFKVTHPYATFLVGGGGHRDTRVEVVRNDDKTPIVRAFGENAEDMRAVLVDLAGLEGKEIFLRIIDGHAGGWGHINFDDFRFHAQRPEIDPPAVLGAADEFAHSGLDPEAGVKAMTVPPGFRVDLFAAEPDVQQPIAMTIDERGRVWVAECYSYPFRVSEAEARDRILIFEDADGDGKFDTRTVFAEKLNMLTGIEVGFGGVFAGAAPHLLFLADKDGDDRADGPPEVLLDGWGLQDTHETLNSFLWGPDGWLYGCHGVFTHSKVGKPGAAEKDRAPLNAGIWRYHPLSKRFEVFAHGTSNPWGVDFNDRGQCFLTACVIPHLFHVIQGARYHRQSGRHFNPFTYDDIKTIARHRHWVGPVPHLGNQRSSAAGGGHAHSGAMIYLGGAWPEPYRDQIFMNNIHGARINQDKLDAAGSGYVGDRAPDFLLANDKWSQILYLRYGPDGQVYMIDWYDANQCHVPVAAVHDRRNGRVYKVSYGDVKTDRVDLGKLTDRELAELQTNTNDWFVRQGRRLLQERCAAHGPSEEARAILARLFAESGDDRVRLRALWAMHVAGGVDEARTKAALRDKSPYVRGWAIQLLLEDNVATSTQFAEMLRLAAEDPSPVARLYLASAAQRLESERSWELLQRLVLHPEDAEDHNLPRMYWYALEPHVPRRPAEAIALAKSSGIATLLSFTVRRVGEMHSGESLAALIEALGSAQNASAQLVILDGIRQGLAGRRRVEMPKAWPAVAARLAKSPHADVRDAREALALVFGDPEALAHLRRTLLDRSADAGRRQEVLASLLAARDPELLEALLEIVREAAIRRPVLRALAAYEDSRVPAAILRLYASLDPAEKRDALATLAERKAWAQSLVDAVRQGRIPSTDLQADLVRQLRDLRDDRVDAFIGEWWGVVRDSPADKARQIAEYKRMLASPSKVKADPTLGRAVFAKTCSQCHKLFGAGGDIGPELTGANRRDLDYVLSNILDPSAVMPKEYVPTIFATADGRVITGLVKAESSDALTIATANETIVLPKAEIDSQRKADKSMMPDDLLRPLRELEVRSLVAYLSSPVQVPVAASAENAKTLFNGKDLTGWTGNPELWSVENGEIVGKSPGVKNNEFLKSELSVADFRLKLKVKLTPNTGNSGIQFRSEVLPDGLVRGYQADIGQGWWGKLYEEHGRGLLGKKPADDLVKVGDWNDYEILAVGSRIQTFLNGKKCVDLDDPEGARQGILALQIHSGPAMEVRFKDLVLEIDPKP